MKGLTKGALDLEITLFLVMAVVYVKTSSTDRHSLEKMIMNESKFS